MEPFVRHIAPLNAARTAGVSSVRFNLVQSSLRPTAVEATSVEERERGDRSLLKLSDLGISTRGGTSVRLLESVSLDIRHGEFFAMVGESGSGKSLLCAALMGILPSNLQVTGEISFDGNPLTVANRSSRAMVFQQPSQYLNPVRTIGFQLRETLQLVSRTSRREAADRAAALLGSVGIHDPVATLGKFPHQMSGGMNQRVMIALALARRPKLLIADEPTSALDVTTQKQIMNLIEKLRTEWNMAVLFVTHDLDLAIERSDRIGVLYAGQLVEVGPTDSLALAPMHPYTRTLFSAAPTISALPSRLHALTGGVPDPTQRGQGCHFASRCSQVLDVCQLIPPPHSDKNGHKTACHNQG
ncbi:ABC transporter ATP-binding protein [Sinorhizobium meliloti]|uniref:ABC transporter ATP-binding protein n=1 Tax=Rhizobium meliloti TaxID=382 RepID=UPI0001E4CDE7|nr:ABC transporter ATP-binding protein [Sinorhizobium meliloti]AEG58240.1 oligopeptide/dipeptide ABC transporter, ATPase subunit [Sinorhizobium meliloti AK83]MDE4589240.1 ABC transporter ATP-binding protein [Sinorhizobium meliloti]SEJ60603.1 peptide/nickel transport system ATP-binding protein [Sinorhizobium meliloti]